MTVTQTPPLLNQDGKWINAMPKANVGNSALHMNPGTVPSNWSASAKATYVGRTTNQGLSKS